MKWFNVAVSTAFAALALGTLSSRALSVGVDLPTNPAVPCASTKDCANGQYCNPSANVCYWGVSATGTCTAATGCPAGSFCHAGRCHVGNVTCTDNTPCQTFEYCHFGFCHAEACNSNNDCPLGVQCITPLNKCALP